MTEVRSRRVLLMVALGCAVLAVYGQVYSYGFVGYDDPGYVRDNLRIRGGLTWAGLRWAFTTNFLGHWHPLTWLSYMLEIQVFGVNAPAMHLVNVALHLANTLLLFALLQRMTGAMWPSFFVAALFGLHPLHVESVAWIAERKDVLSTLFWLLTMWAYARYAAEQRRSWYAAVLLFFSLGLMAKPMLVTLPFVLLLMDWWPLGRLGDTSVGGSGAIGSERVSWLPFFVSKPTAIRLFREKVPLFLLTILFSAIAYVTQMHAGAMDQEGRLPLWYRVSNAMVSYVLYLYSTVWPVDLAVLYPYDVDLPFWQGILAADLLVVITVICWRLAPRHPYALVGWLWYLGTLVPVIGLVQIGSQALADRYTYIPLIGIFIVVAWAGRVVVERFRVPAAIAVATSTVVVSAYAVVAWSQVRLWRSSEVLFRHTISVTKKNCVTMNNLGVALAMDGRMDEALSLYRAALEIQPEYPDAQTNVGLVLWRRGQRQEAAEHYRAALRAAPHLASAHSSLALILAELGQVDAGLVEVQEALRLDPELPEAWVHLGVILHKLGRVTEASDALEKSLQLDPSNPAAHTNLGIVRTSQGRFGEAGEALEKSLNLNPNNPAVHTNLGIVRARQGRPDEAVDEFRTALRLDPNAVDAWNNLGLVQGEQGKTADAVSSLAEALRLAPEQADVRINYGNALYAVGRLPEAVQEYDQALRLAPDSVSARHRLAVVLTETGRNRDAIEQYEEVLRRDPNHAQAHNDLGVALINLKRTTEAISHFEKALAINPALGDAQVNLEVARSMAEPAANSHEVAEERPAAGR